MKNPFIVSFTLGLLMMSTALLSKVMSPVSQMNKLQDKLHLETMIPREFASWKTDQSASAMVVNPDGQGLLNKIYHQTLSRTYINSKSERIMLSIAYGGDQSTDLHIHRPENCYVAAGYDVGRISKIFVDSTIGQIPAMRLVAKQGSRNEPLIYWIRVGDSLTRGWFEQKLTAMGYGLTGKLPDGLLFRVSTISNDETDSFRIQQKFVSELLQAMKQEDRYWLVGSLTLASNVNSPAFKN